MNLQLNVIALLFVSVISSQGLAFIDLQITGGSRTAKNKYEAGSEKREKSVKSTEITVSAHISPVKVLPVSVGVFTAMNNYDLTPAIKDQLDNEVTEDETTFSNAQQSLTGLTYGPEIMAWLPLPFLKPFLRLGYVMGGYTDTVKYDLQSDSMSGKAERKTIYGASGTNIGLGAIYSPIPFFGMLLEYNIGSEVLKAKKVKFSADLGELGTMEEETNGEELTDTEKTRKVSSGAIRLGLVLNI